MKRKDQAAKGRQEDFSAQASMRCKPFTKSGAKNSSAEYVVLKMKFAAFKTVPGAMIPS